MERRKFSREFKLEAVKLGRDRGVRLQQAGRDLDLHETVLRKCINAQASDPVSAFPGNGQRKPEQLEIEQLRREVTRILAAELDLEQPGDQPGDEAGDQPGDEAGDQPGGKRSRMLFRPISKAGKSPETR